MRKTILTLAITLTCICAFAQQGEKAVGLNLSYGTEIKNLGIGVKGQYDITSAIRAEASFDYFLKKEGLSMWDVNFNVHYLFPLTDKVKVYPLAGLSYTNWKLDISDVWDDFDDYYDDDWDNDDSSSSTGKFGINLGGGIQYNITDVVTVNFEAKYQLINDFDQMIFGVVVAYKF